MARNPILEELHAARQQLLADCGGDTAAYLKEARARLEASGRPIAIREQKTLRLPESGEEPGGAAATGDATADPPILEGSDDTFGKGINSMAHRHPLQLSIGIQVGVILLGYLCGSSGGRGKPITSEGMLAFLGIVLMTTGLFTATPEGVAGAKERHQRQVFSVLALAHSLGLVLWEPFLFIRDETDLVVAGAVLCPLLLALGYFVRVRARTSLVGVALFVFASTVMLTRNAGTYGFGSGFLGYWIS